MMRYKINHSENTLRVNGTEFLLGYNIIESFLMGDKIIVLYDPDQQQGNVGQFANIECFSLQGDKIWTVELPTTYTGDSYYQIHSIRPFVADSVQSYRCHIDLSTGKIMKREFVK